jgi:hypothetical protein
MPPRIRYRQNRAGTRKIMTGEQMAEVMKKRAEAALPYAQNISPERSGAYKAAFRVETTRRGGPRGDRAEARLINDSVYAPAVERRHHVLGRTVDQIESGS